MTVPAFVCSLLRPEQNPGCTVLSFKAVARSALTDSWGELVTRGLNGAQPGWVQGGRRFMDIQRNASALLS